MAKTGERKQKNKIPLRIALIYAAVGCLWIFFSDLFLSVAFPNLAIFARYEMFKGWLFIVTTSVLLFLLIRRDMEALRRSEEAVRRSEEKFHMLFEATASANFIYRDRFLLVNSAMETLTGYGKEELRELTYADLVHSDFREDMRRHCDALLRGEARSHRCEFKIVRKDGSERWVDFMSNIITYEGLPAGLGTAFDITSRKNTEEALRKSEENLRLLVNGITDYEIFMLDPEGKILSWNLGAERSKGYRTEEVIGSPHSIFFTKEDIGRGVPMIELKTAAEKGRFEDEGWRVRKDGSRFWADVVTTPLLDAGGALRGFVKVIRDITERKKAEESLRESEERYRVIAETASDAIITIDEESIIIFANRSVRKIFGYAPEELVGKSLTMLMPERFRRPHIEGMKRHLQTGKRDVSWEAVEMPGLYMSGREVPLEISYGTFVKGGKHFFTGVVRDITERRQAEKEKEYKDMLERFNQELEALVSERTMSLMALRLADRVRTPAAVIGWTGKRLFGRPDIQDRWKDGLTTIVNEAEKLEAIVRDFHSLIKQRKSAFSYEDINDIVSDVLNIIKREAENKGIEVVADLSGAPLRTNVQKDLFRMAIFYMLRNAVESTPQGGTITIKTASADDSVVLSISDTGTAVPAEVLDKIFDPLYSTKIYRFGMGLPLVRQIVSEHLGEIRVMSAGEKGKTFTITLPVRWMEKAVGEGQHVSR
jgi:PAS domain S-box-containing protein